MKKPSKKIILVIILIGIVSILLFPIRANADSEGDSLLNKIGEGASFLNNGNEAEVGLDSNAIVDKILGIAEILWFVGGAILIAGTIYMGVQYGRASAENKAKTKSKLVEWIIIAVVIIGAYPIWKICIEMYESVIS